MCFTFFCKWWERQKPYGMGLNEKKCWRNRQVKEWKIVMIICKKKVGFWCLFAKKYVNLQSINRVYMKSENLIPSSFHDETQAKSVFQNFYTRYYRMLVGYAMSFVKSEGDAEDIVQDVFITIWTKRDDLKKDHTRMMRLLYVSIHNKCLDFLKHSTVERIYASNASVQMTEYEMESEIFAAEMYSRIFTYIDALPDRQRKTLLLAMEGKTNAEIAEEMQVKIETVKTQKYKAISTLRTVVSKEECLLLLLLLDSDIFK